jgi:succinate dehydrogenase/fumarate reductase-like Fe-S protein
MDVTKDLESKQTLIPIFVMGKKYMVPERLTIMKAMEYAGFQYVRGCGCRGGICGACATVYRRPRDYHIYVGLACQTLAEPEMYLTQMPFYPANRAVCDFAAVGNAPEEIFKLYPEIFRCLACNNCTKACPMDVPVMDAISALKRGDVARAAELSFSCIQCGLCTSRCLGELPQYHMFQLARRVYGSKIAPRDSHLGDAVAAAGSDSGRANIEALMRCDTAELTKAYRAREMEPEMAGEDWTPKRSDYTQ